MKKFKEFVVESINANQYREPTKSIIKKELEYIDDVFTLFTDRGFKYKIEGISKNKSFVYYNFAFYKEVNNDMHNFSTYYDSDEESFGKWKEINENFNDILKRAYDILSVNFKFDSIDYCMEDKVSAYLVSNITDKKFEK